MNILDLGNCTGLLLERVTTFVKKIIAVDVSEARCKLLNEKINNMDCEVEILQLDLTKTKLDMIFD